MDLISQFRAFGFENSINPLSKGAQTLYYNMLQIFNVSYWPEILAIRTQTLESHCQMSRKQLVAGRDELIERGFIIYHPEKQASASPSYELVFLNDGQKETQKARISSAKNKSCVSKIVQNGNTERSQKETQTASKEKHLIKTNTIDKDIDKDIASNEASNSEFLPAGQVEQKKEERKKVAPKKKEETPTPHWQALVAVWFKFYEDNYGAQPTFDGVATKSLKTILKNLQERSERANHEWVEGKATQTLLAFLTHAHKDSWRANHFTLQNLNNQFDIITQPNGQATSKNGTANSQKSTMAGTIAIVDKMYPTNGNGGR